MQLRTPLRFMVLAAASAAFAIAQNPPPEAPAAQQAPPAPPAGPGAVPAAPPAAPPKVPPVDPANFPAKTPTKQTVEDFLNAFWGYDHSREWQIQAILPTPAEGVSRVL